MIEMTIEHDTWNYSPPKLPPKSKIELDPIYGIIPFDGERNPSGRSAIAHKVFFTYKTEANNWKPKTAIAESAAEMAATLEALISPDTYDIKLQPLTVYYLNEHNKRVSYTHDLLITRKNGYRQLVFVRHDQSLSKPSTWRAIKAICKATSATAADELVIANANDYPRQRRENLIRLHHFVMQPDPQADDVLLQTVHKLKSIRLMEDLLMAASLPRSRAFAACYRLIAQGHIVANMNNVIWEKSHINLPSKA